MAIRIIDKNSVARLGEIDGEDLGLLIEQFE